jgi:SAM-dependent methyltransferase
MEQHEWEEYYDGHEEPWATPDELLVAEIEGLPPGRALDLGAGEGANSIWLAEHGWEVTAVDFAPAAIRHIEQIATSRGLAIKGVVADILEYQPEERFDLVIVCFVHFPPDKRAILLANAAAALAPGGTLLFIAVAAWQESFGEVPRDLFATGDEIAAGLPDLLIEQAEVLHRTIPFPDDPFDGDGVIVRARRPAAST